MSLTDVISSCVSIYLKENAPHEPISAMFLQMNYNQRGSLSCGDSWRNYRQLWAKHLLKNGPVHDLFHFPEAKFSLYNKTKMVNHFLAILKKSDRKLLCFQHVKYGIDTRIAEGLHRETMLVLDMVALMCPNKKTSRILPK